MPMITLLVALAIQVQPTGSQVVSDNLHEHLHTTYGTRLLTGGQGHAAAHLLCAGLQLSKPRA